MKRLFVVLFVLLAMLVAGNAIASNTEQWSPISALNATLTISRTALAGDLFQWTYNVKYTGTKTLTIFNVSILPNALDVDGNGIISGNHIWDINSSIGVDGDIDGLDVFWTGINLKPNNSANFYFTTDFAGKGISSAVACGSGARNTSEWEEVWVPTATQPGDIPETPEPAGLVALFCGCVGLFARLKK